VPSPTPALRSALAPTTLEAETRLVRAGVGALHAGDSVHALALFDEHARLYPTGALAEERAAERVIALGDLRRCDDARAAALAFLRDHPSSPLAARVRTACASTPIP
jgi:outer membrane protein assembly factor BamD (BamD/ComL family)